MKLTSIVAGAALLWTAVGQAGTANVAETQKENLSAQARVLAIAAGNLENAVRGRALTDADAEAAGAVVDFHSRAENMARVTERWLDTRNVNNTYDELILAWAKVKDTFPSLKADKLTQESYDRAMKEFDKLDRYGGFGGKTYLKKREGRKK